MKNSSAIKKTYNSPTRRSRKRIWQKYHPSIWHEMRRGGKGKKKQKNWLADDDPFNLQYQKAIIAPIPEQVRNWPSFIFTIF